MERVHLVISGDVQGIGFRAWARQQARALELTGWVKNRDDGAVEVVAEGRKKDLEELIKACLAKRDPASQEVEKVEVEWGGTTGESLSFEVVY